MAHVNIPIFIPHMGCPNQCVFCNQRSISGQRDFCVGDVERQIEAALSTVRQGDEVEIAFFGGSFTGIDRGLMITLLDIAQRYVRAGKVGSIRLSTRPDYISDEILDILSGYSVRVIELGLQSMDDRVLKASHRGHTAADAEKACRAVVSSGFVLVGQMMIGLPEATEESETETALRIVSLGAAAVRIYPTVVFYDTLLCEMTANGVYKPLTTEVAVARAASVLRIFSQNGIPCIRIGLCATEHLASPEKVLAGPNHPALGELVWNAYYYGELLDALRERGLLGCEVALHLPQAAVSKYVGQHRCNIERLLRETNTRVRKVVGDKKGNGVCPLAWHTAE